MSLPTADRRIAVVLSLLFALAGVVSASGEDRIALDPPLVVPQTAAVRQAVDRIVSRALFASRTVYAESFLIDEKSPGAEDAYLLHPRGTSSSARASPRSSSMRCTARSRSPGSSSWIAV